MRLQTAREHERSCRLVKSQEGLYTALLLFVVGGALAAQRSFACGERATYDANPIAA